MAFALQDYHVQSSRLQRNISFGQVSIALFCKPFVQEDVHDRLRTSLASEVEKKLTFVVIHTKEIK